MKLIQNLLEMGEYEENTHKSYDKEEEAKGHAKEFLDKAAEVLNHNKKEGGTEEVIKLALQMAKDYHESICEAIQGEKYAGAGEETGPDLTGSDIGGDEMGMGY